MDLLLAIFGGAIVAAIAYAIGRGRGYDDARKESAIIIARWKELAGELEGESKKLTDRFRRDNAWNVSTLAMRRKRSSFSSPIMDPTAVYTMLQRTAYGRHVPKETVEDWSLEHRELAYIWALQTIGGQVSPAPLCIMVHVPVPGEKR